LVPDFGGQSFIGSKSSPSSFAAAISFRMAASSRAAISRSGWRNRVRTYRTIASRSSSVVSRSNAGIGEPSMPRLTMPASTSSVGMPPSVPAAPCGCFSPFTVSVNLNRS
jgi:hypothetical protein